jgi:broad specificity phosphatase PhoE
MPTIIFETHATSVDNEMGLASGQHDAELSAVGRQQAAELGRRHLETELAAVFCSDLQRSYLTAEIAFAGRDVRIVRDRRLRECDYGILTRQSQTVIERERNRRITDPFPGGESYRQAADRVGEFLMSLAGDYRGKTILVIGHRATHYALEHWINGLPLTEVVAARWFWQPGWIYQLPV